jgi:NAD(P)H-dependent FMN reductase
VRPLFSRDCINLLSTDIPFAHEDNPVQVSSYMAKLRQAVLDALQEEAVLVVASPVYHVE